MNRLEHRISRLEGLSRFDPAVVVTGIVRSFVDSDGKVTHRIFRGLGVTPEEREANRKALEMEHAD